MMYPPIKTIRLITSVFLLTQLCLGCSAERASDSQIASHLAQSDHGKMVAPTNPFAESMDKVEGTFKYLRSGKQLMDQGRYEEAIAELLKLEGKSPAFMQTARTLISECYDKLGDAQRALQYYEEFLKNASDRNTTMRKEKYNYYRQKAGLDPVE